MKAGAPRANPLWSGLLGPPHWLRPWLRRLALRARSTYTSDRNTVSAMEMYPYRPARRQHSDLRSRPLPGSEGFTRRQPGGRGSSALHKAGRQPARSCSLGPLIPRRSSLYRAFLDSCSSTRDSFRFPSFINTQSHLFIPRCRTRVCTRSSPAP